MKTEYMYYYSPYIGDNHVRFAVGGRFNNEGLLEMVFTRCDPQDNFSRDFAKELIQSRFENDQYRKFKKVVKIGSDYRYGRFIIEAKAFLFEYLIRNEKR
jgi:hypothetical protein